MVTDLNNAFLWMVSTYHLIYKSYRPCTNPLVTVPCAPVAICISVTFMFHSFFRSLERSWYLSLFSLSFSFTLWSAGTAKFTIRQVLFFCGLSLGLVVWPKLGDRFESQNPREVCASHFLERILSCAYTTCSYGQTQTSYTIPSGSPSPPSHILSYTLFVPIYCIRLLRLII